MTRVLLHGGEVFDGTGTPPTRADVVLEDSRIVEVGTGLDGDEAIDCSGQTIIPGLFDCHVHAMLSSTDVVAGLHKPFSYRFYEATHNLRAMLDVGITTVRDAGGSDLGLRQALERGLVPGPRMQISIAALSQTGGHGDTWHACGAELSLFPVHPGRPDGIVDGPDEMRKKVRQLARMGADVIKVATSGGVISPRSDPLHSHFRDAELAVLGEEAAAAGIPFMAHAQAANGIKAAIRHGARSIEHGIFLDDEAIELMLAHDVWLVPTLSAPLALLRQIEGGAAMSELVRDKVRSVVDVHSEAVSRAVEAGVRIAMGTDSGVGRHGENLGELSLLAGCGMTPEQVLHTATGSAAELLGLASEVGTVAPGMTADLVLVREDALRLDDLDQRISAVLQAGRVVVDKR